MQAQAWLFHSSGENVYHLTPACRRLCWAPWSPCAPPPRRIRSRGGGGGAGSPPAPRPRHPPPRSCWPSSHYSSLKQDKYQATQKLPSHANFTLHNHNPRTQRWQCSPWHHGSVGHMSATAQCLLPWLLMRCPLFIPTALAWLLSTGLAISCCAPQLHHTTPGPLHGLTPGL